MKISVVVPTFDDSELAKKNLKELHDIPGIDVIVVDAKEAGRANRAYQMNLGAQKAKGDLLVFLHADTKVELDDLVELTQIMERSPELAGGAFRFALDQTHWRAKLIEFGVWLRERLFQLPYGDQAIFVRRSVFEKIGGYPDAPFLEDVLFVKKIMSPSPQPPPLKGGGKEKRFLYFPRRAVTSARCWEKQGYLKTTLVNWTTMILWRLGVSLETILIFRRRVFHDPVYGDTKKEPARNQTEAA